MSDARWFRNVDVHPHPTPSPGARLTTTVITSILLFAESLGDRPTLVIQCRQTLDFHGFQQVQRRDVTIDYRDDELYQYYVDSTTGAEDEVEVGTGVGIVPFHRLPPQELDSSAIDLFPGKQAIELFLLLH